MSVDEQLKKIFKSGGYHTHMFVVSVYALDSIQLHSSWIELNLKCKHLLQNLKKTLFLRAYYYSIFVKYCVMKKLQWFEVFVLLNT